MVALIVLLFWLGTRRMKVVPGRGQTIMEFVLGFVQSNIAEGNLGKKEGARFAPLLTSIFIIVLGMNLVGIVPGINLAGTSVIGLPLVLAVVAYVTFIYAGIKRHGGGFSRPRSSPPACPRRSTSSSRRSSSSRPSSCARSRSPFVFS